MKPDWTVTTDDGVVLGAAVTEPAGEAVADVLLLHAMMVDARALDRPVGAGLASTLAARGFRVHRADLRGRGMSPCPMGWTYDDLVYRDVPALVSHLGRPWVVGHSLGGHVTAASWASGHVDLEGLVGLAANAWLRDAEPDRLRRAKKALGVLALDVAARGLGRLPARRIGMGPVDESGPYAHDLASFWRRGWRDREGRDWEADLASLRGRMLFVASDGDALLAHPAGAEGFVRHAPNVELLRVRHGDFGLARAPDHMGLAVDGASRPVWEAVADWMLHA
ncbi:MAG: alpha/beta fold hydrolase [Myxococcales bacterium]|nr:alpha/beta fold hydrolase [Myxococcales bacterium]